MRRFASAARAVAALSLFSLPCLALAADLEFVASYDTGLGGNGAEIIDVRAADGLAALTNIDGSVDILDLFDPSSPLLLRRIAIDGDLFGTPNSVAVHPRFDFVVVVGGGAGRVGTASVWSAVTGELLAAGPVGIQPDSVGISPDGLYAVVANEAEAVSEGNDGGPGSISIINLSLVDRRGGSPLVVTTLPLPSQNGTPGFSTDRTDDIGRLPIDNSPGTLEPESVAFSPDSRYAFVTLQENSGIVRVELQTGALTFFGTGRTSHLADTSTSGGYNPVTTIDLYREPDGIGVTPDGRYLVTADEGDTRNATGGSGIRGGRTVTVYDAASGAVLGDTANQLDDAAAGIGRYPDSRSNRGGSEPEVLDVTRRAGRTLVAVGLERANALALVDVTVPASPAVVAIEPTDVGPEGIAFFERFGELYVACANEASGTVTILRVLP